MTVRETQPEVKTKVKKVPVGSVLMVHKDFKDRDPVEVSRKAFETTWKENGWVEFKSEAGAEAKLETPPEDEPKEGPQTPKT
jgi:hypothetical protein